MPNTPVTWLDEFVVNTTTTGAQFDPDITQLANGNLLLSWTTSDAGGLGSPNGNETFAQIFDPLGTKIGGEIRLNNASTGGDEQNADLAALPNGGFLVVYHDLDNPPSAPAGGSNIRLEEYDANGNQVTENAAVVIDSGMGGDPNYRNPRVAVSSASGFALVVYEQFTATGTAVVGKLYDPVTDTYGSQITLINASGPIDAAPDIAVLSSGNFVIASSYNFGGDNAIVYTILTAAGGGFLGPTFIPNTSTNGFNDREASVTALAGGGFVIAWTNTDANDTDILLRVYDNNGTQIGSASPGDNGASNNNNECKVIALADGTFVVAWDNDEAIGVNVQHYSAIGGLLGAAFTVSAQNANNISGVGLGDGRFALVWDVSGGEIAMEILDTRDAPNNPGAYTPDQWQVGTPVADTFTLDTSAKNAAGGLGSDTITGNTDSNLLFGNEGNDTLRGLGANDTLDGGGGTDTADYSQAAGSGVTVNLTLAGPQPISATEGSDALIGIENVTGSSLNDNLTGNGSSNLLDGGLGNDAMAGGAQNDTYFVDGAGDTVSEALNQGYDTVNTTTASFTLGANVERVNSTSGTDFVGTGNALDNRFQSLGGDDRFVDVLGGADIFSGGIGTDTVDFRTSSVSVNLNFVTDAHGGAAAGDSYSSIEKFLGSNTANDTMLMGGTGRAVFVGGGGNDTLTGGVKNDQLIGQAGSDTLSGGADKDSLQGGADNDTMTGGAQADVFVYTNQDADFGDDTITDYQDGLDSLKVHSNVADDVSDFIISGNGSTKVLLTLAANPAHSISVQGATAIVITNGDFVFY